MAEYLALDLGWARHPKIRGLTDTRKVELLTLMLWCRENNTDGYFETTDLVQISDRFYRRRDRGLFLKALIENGLVDCATTKRRPILDQSLTTGGDDLVKDNDQQWSILINHDGRYTSTTVGRYRIHDWLDYQEPEAKIETRKQQAKERSRKWRSNMGRPTAPVTGDASQDDQASVKRNGEYLAGDASRDGSVTRYPPRARERGLEVLGLSDQRTSSKTHTRDGDESPTLGVGTTPQNGSTNQADQTPEETARAAQEFVDRLAARQPRKETTT